MFRKTEIGFWGGQALLVSSITGPALTTGISAKNAMSTYYCSSTYISAGWMVPVHYQNPRLTGYRPVLAIIVVGILSASASLFLVEAMSHIRGNERFQAQVEFATIAELYLGRKSHYILQVILYLALQSVNISSIIISCQVRFLHSSLVANLSRVWIRH
jgi:hypothetical protein